MSPGKNWKRFIAITRKQRAGEWICALASVYAGDSTRWPRITCCQTIASFEALLPDTYKALDWTLAEIKGASAHGGATRGLVEGELNTDGQWVLAFNEAYL